MATVVSITNPITGAVEQVDKLDHTAQQIDDAVALSTQLSNHNLLDNWYFGNPVNQRGQTEYTGEGYGPDRWRLFGNTITCSITPDGLTLVSNGENSILECYLDTDLTGKTVTMSALIDGIVYSGSKTVDQHDFAGAVSFPGGTIRVFYSGGKTVFRLWLSNVAGTTVQLKAVKLELGSQQTLAHQENGVWVLNEIPDYGEQLARCQRYQVALPYFSTIGVSANTTTLLCTIPTPVPMRTVPSIENNGVFQLRGSGSIVKNLTASVYSTSLTPNGIKVGLSGTFDANVPYHVDILSPIILNANL